MQAIPVCDAQNEESAEPSPTGVAFPDLAISLETWLKAICSLTAEQTCQDVRMSSVMEINQLVPSAEQAYTLLMRGMLETGWAPVK